MTGRLNSAQPYALGLYRIVVGLLFLCHGAASSSGSSAVSRAPTAAPSKRAPGPAGTRP